MKYDSLKELDIVEERTPDTAEVLALYTRAERDLMVSRQLLDTDEEWAYAVAYLTMARSARALMLAEGYRPRTSRGRDIHKTMVTAAGIFLGSERKSLINKFDRMRRKYQNFMEDAGKVITRYEAGQAVKDAEEFLALVNDRIREKYSQMSLLNDSPQLASR